MANRAEKTGTIVWFNPPQISNDMARNYRSYGKKLDEVGAALAALDQRDSAQRRRLQLSIRHICYQIFFPNLERKEAPPTQKPEYVLPEVRPQRSGGPSVPAKLIPSAWREEGQVEDMAEVENRPGPKPSILCGAPLLSLSKVCYETLFLPLLSQLEHGTGDFRAQSGGLLTYLTMRMLTAMGEQIVDHMQMRAAMWRRLPPEQRAAGIPDCTDITEKTACAFLHDTEEQRRHMFLLPADARQDMERLFLQDKVIWDDVFCLACGFLLTRRYVYISAQDRDESSKGMEGRQTTPITDNRGSQRQPTEICLSYEDQYEIVLELVMEARRLFHGKNTLFNMLYYRFPRRTIDHIRKIASQTAGSINAPVNPDEPELGPLEEQIAGPLPSAGTSAEYQAGWYELAALILSFRQRSNRKGQDFPYYRVLFTSDMMSVLKQGSVSFVRERDLMRAMQFRFVNFCLRPECSSFQDIIRAQLKTYDEVLEEVPKTRQGRPLNLPTESHVNTSYLNRYEVRDRSRHTIYDRFRKLEQSYCQYKYEQLS